ncbi:MAG: hypothetical protein ABI779_05425 [Acidobacteriota bacterium]
MSTLSTDPADRTLPVVRPARSAWRETMWVELCCLWQCARFSRRHRRYFVIFLAIYGPSLLHWRRLRAVRTGFCAAQWIDDLLDGDRPSKREPLEVIEELRTEMANGRFSSQPLSRLTAALFAGMAPDGQREFMDLVSTMQCDRKRVMEKEVWSEDALRDHHRTTFRLSVNLLLRTTRCHARAEDVPSLIAALSWCSVFRDLDDDLRKGLINVPGPIWNAASTDELSQWARQSRVQAAAWIARAAEEVGALSDPRARRILGIFQRSVAHFERKLR